ncbi:hypothetical protein Csa_017612, partial [Cucumis sativus]
HPVNVLQKLNFISQNPSAIHTLNLSSLQFLTKSSLVGLPSTQKVIEATLQILKPKPFVGANVFLSRNLVAPEMFDAFHDTFKQNGAEVFLCCDPSQNAPNDYHVISSANH